jgi:hypothetical protein
MTYTGLSDKQRDSTFTIFLEIRTATFNSGTGEDFEDKLKSCETTGRSQREIVINLNSTTGL